MPLLVSDITPLIASKLNDAAQITYTDAVILPHVETAWEELKLELSLTGAVVINEQSIPLTLAAGATSLFDAGIQPSNLLEPLSVMERLSGSTDLYLPMSRLEWEPQLVQTDSLRFWNWRKQQIITPGATTARQLLLHYQYALIEITSPNDTLNVNYCKLFMVYRSAADVARFVGNNKTRADTLDVLASKYLFKLNGINTRSKQGTRTRRKPFKIRKITRWN